jgi:DNA (cytosine-5)-methyltransferase 1
MKYGSVCSGIEAASVAWEELGWEPQWFSEIEDFPSKVLKYRYPHVHNLGDMTKLKSKKEYNESTINVLVGGTPCQAFSIAGLRAGLGDERSNLALEFCRILIDKHPKWFVWENVPGVFSSFSDEENYSDGTGECVQRGVGDTYTESSDFATLLSAFRECGYSVSWRILDARYFGVPQRRRRVFVVGHFGDDWRPSAAVLFERESLRRDFAPGGKKRKGSPKVAKEGVGVKVFRLHNIGEYKDDGTASAMKKRDYKGATDLVIQSAYAFKERGGKEGGGKGFLGSDELAFSLSAQSHQSVMHPVVYDTTQITSPYNGSNPQPGDPCHSLSKGAHSPLLVTVDPENNTHQLIVRRLTPLEHERLQGFPDGWTNIPGASDSNRYAVLGNSMAVPVMEWIGERIDLVEKCINIIAK